MPKTTKPKLNNKPNSPAEYEKLGRQLIEFYQTGYFDKRQMYKMTLIKGILAGLGGVIGATIVVAIIVAILSMFQEVPLLGPFTEKVQNTINTHSTQQQ